MILFAPACFCRLRSWASVWVGSARQVGVFAHAFQRHFSAELPHQVGHQRFGRCIGSGQRQAVAQLQRRVAGHRHGGGGVVQRTQPRKHRVADALPHLGRVPLSASGMSEMVISRPLSPSMSEVKASVSVSMTSAA